MRMYDLESPQSSRKSPTSEQAKCPLNWHEFNHNCYLLRFDSLRYYPDAKFDCQKQGRQIFVLMFQIKFQMSKNKTI